MSKQSAPLDVNALIEAEAKRIAIDLLNGMIKTLSTQVKPKRENDRRADNGRTVYPESTRTAVLASISSDPIRKGAAQRASDKHGIPYPTVMRWIKSAAK